MVRLQQASIASLEPLGTTACVVHLEENRVCVYQRTASAIGVDHCYPIAAVRARGLPRWLVVDRVTARRIYLVDETGDRRVEVIPSDRAVTGDSLFLAQRDFSALSVKMVPWRTAWVVQQAPGGGETLNTVGAAVRDALERWRLAWEQKDFDAYAQHYSASFVPQMESSVASWRQHKRTVFERSAKISVHLTPPSIFVLEPGAIVITSFGQHYRSNLSALDGFKVLRWQLEQGQWRIKAERVLTEVRPAGGAGSSGDE